MAKGMARSDMGVLEPAGAASPKPERAAPRQLPTYRPTRWALVNRALDTVDALTRGRAEWVQRLVSYLAIGGTAALINIAALTIMLNDVLPPSHDAFSHRWHFVLASVVAYEVSIFANFIPNDYFTFRFLPGHQRSWWARCLRFHMTAVGGVIVTFLISGTLYEFLKLNATLAQAIALLLAVFFNFTFHHIFTYRAQHASPLVNTHAD